VKGYGHTEDKCFTLEKAERKLKATKAKINEVHDDNDENSDNSSSSKNCLKTLLLQQENLNQITKEKLNNSSIQPKPPETTLGDPSIINLIRQTCIRLAFKEVFEINNVVRKLDARSLIEINLTPMMKGKWLFVTSARLICMSSQQLWLKRQGRTS
jgi:hypothetical protein